MAPPFPARNGRGILLAVLAYAAWGFLSPVGQILVERMGPFTANTIRTFGSLPFLIALLGPRATGAALRSLSRESAGWILGGFWLSLCLVPYLWSLKYLPPTITTLTVYLTPLIVAVWARIRHHERPSRLLVPTVAATLLGGYFAVRAPGGAPPDVLGLLGLALAMLGVVGWSGYTIYLKHLTRTRDADELTLVAFFASGVVFAAGGLAFEGLAVDWSNDLAFWLAVYILFPSVVSFFLYSRALRLANATTVAVLLGVELVATAVISFFIRDEAFSVLKVLGLGLVTVAVTAYLWDERRRETAAHADPGASESHGAASR